MIIEVRVPDIGETHGFTIAKWLKETGDVVDKDEAILEIESDKALMTLNAEEAGKIEVLVGNEDVDKNQLLARIDTSFKPEPKHPYKSSPHDIVGR